MSEADLFMSEAFGRFMDEDPAIEREARTVYDFFVTIEGLRFDAADLSRTLYEVFDGDVATTFSREKYDVLRRLGILESQGSRRSGMAACAGPNARTFVEWLDQKIDERNPNA